MCLVLKEVESYPAMPKSAAVGIGSNASLLGHD